MPTISTATAEGRRTLAFSVRGLSARDETLLKSFVRLLAHRTEHLWKPVEGACDVLVLAQGLPCMEGTGERVLVVGAQRGGERHFVRMPFHADELEAALNGIGGVAAPPPRLPAGSSRDVAGVPMFSLMRWPPPALLTGSARVRLATLLSVQPVTLHALQERSGCDAATCSRFVEELATAGVLGVRAPVAAPVRRTPVPDIPPGLVGRIRARLGRMATARA